MKTVHYDPRPGYPDSFAGKTHRGVFPSKVRLVRVANPDTCMPPPLEAPVPFPPVTKDDIVQAIRSFSNGSSGGQGGLRPQHLKNLVSASAERGGRELL